MFKQLLQDDEDSKPFKIKFKGRTWYYHEGALCRAGGASGASVSASVSIPFSSGLSFPSQTSEKKISEGASRMFASEDGFWQTFTGHGQGIGPLEEVKFTLSFFNDIKGSDSISFKCSINSVEVGTFDVAPKSGGVPDPQMLTHSFRAPFPGGVVDVGESVRLEVRSSKAVPSCAGNWLIGSNPPGNVTMTVAPFTHPFHENHTLKLSSLSSGLTL